MKKILVTVFIASTSFLMNNEKNLLPNLTLIQRIKNYSGNESWKGLVWSTGFSRIAGLTFLGIKKQLPQLETIKVFLKTIPKTQKYATVGFTGLSYLLPQVYNFLTYTNIAKAKNIAEIMKFFKKTDECNFDSTENSTYYFQPNPLKILAQRLDKKSLENKIIIDDIIQMLSGNDLNELLDLITNKENKLTILNHLKESINEKINTLSDITTIDEWILLFQLINKDTQRYDRNINNMVKGINIKKIKIPIKELAEHNTVNSTELYHLPRTIYKVIIDLNTKKAERVVEKGLVLGDYNAKEKTFSDYLFDVVVSKLNGKSKYYYLHDAVYVFSCFDKTNIEENSDKLKKKIQNFKNPDKGSILPEIYEKFSDENNQLLILYWFNLNFLQKNYKVSQYKNNWYKNLINLFMNMEDNKYKNEKKIFLDSNKENIKKEIDSNNLKDYFKKECSHFDDFYSVI